MVRLSVVDRGTGESGDYKGFFDYNSKFKHKWEEYALHSKLVKAEPGTTTRYLIPTPQGKVPVDVRIPSITNGTSGVWFGDPCGVKGSCLASMGPRLSSLLTAAAPHLDYWMVVGDNFYGKKGEQSSRFFSHLGMVVTSLPLLTTPGNHDYWYNAIPQSPSPHDQLGRGFMQFYAQDTMAGSGEGVSFLDFSGSPNSLAHPSNFQQYKQLGNTGFLLYSGANPWEEQSAFFLEACEYFKREAPSIIFLASHWSEDRDGAAKGMDVRTVRERVLKLPGCQIGSGLKGVFGHTHCNKKEDGNHFMVGGSGFHSDCDQAGFVWISTKDNQLVVVEYDYSTSERLKTLLSCLPAHGPAGCTRHGKVWVREALPHNPSL